MGELLPLAIGVGVGLVLLRFTSTAAKTIVFPVLCALGGVLASAINGELTHGSWAFFVSFDTVLVWAAAACTMAGAWSKRKLRGAT